MKHKERLDVLLVARNLAESRSKAQAMIMAGEVYVNEQKADKAGEPFRENDLVVKTTYVDEGVTLKRFRARAQGRAARINKRTSHITVIVANKEGDR